MKTKNIAVILFLILCINCYSQSYTLSVTNKPYINLDSSFKITKDTAWVDTVGYATYLPLHFLFEFNKIFYDNIWISKAGVVTFFHPQTFKANRIYGLFTNMNERNISPPYVSSISVKPNSLNGHGVFTVQYKNVGLYLSKDTGYFANIQIKLIDNGEIEFHYGPSKTNKNCWYYNFGPYVGFTWNEQTVFSMLAGLPDSPIILQKDTQLYDIPANGTVYKFTPTNLVVDEKIQSNSVLKVYPNPSGEKIKIEISNEQNIKIISIYNELGQIVLSDCKLINKEIDISTLSNGKYVVYIQTLNAIYNSRFVKSE